MHSGCSNKDRGVKQLLMMTKWRMMRRMMRRRRMKRMTRRRRKRMRRRKRKRKTKIAGQMTLEKKKSL